jgi:pyroglutamyl-peptidase
MKILVTGFEPFGGSTTNPSEQAARALEGTTICGAQIATAILPVTWEQAPVALANAQERHRPDAVLCLGEASSRPVLSIERVAINLLDFRIPDNSGLTLTDQPVVSGGPAAYFVTLPDRAVLNAVQAAGVPAELSLSAGTYLCNAILYSLLHRLAGSSQHVPAGFIHLPALPQQVAVANQRTPTMSLDTILVGLRAAIEVIAQQINAD